MDDLLVANVVRRFARAQLAPLLKNVERVVKSENWPKAEDELRDFGKLLGIFPLGGDRLSIRTEWLHGLDDEDKQRFLDFAGMYQNVFNEVYAVTHHPEYYKTIDDRTHTWIQNLYDELPAIQEMMRDDSDAYTHGKFKIIPLKGVTDTREAVECLDKASELVHRKFPEVLYGKVYVRKDLRPKGTHDPRPGSGGMVAGAYTDATDIITLSMYATPERNSVMTLIHEFGHRYCGKFLKGEKRSKFIKLSTEGETVTFTPAERQKAADEYMKLFEQHQKEEYPDPDEYLSESTREYDRLKPRDLKRETEGRLLAQFRDEKDNSVWQKLHDAIALKNIPGDVEFPAEPQDIYGRSKGVYASDYGREGGWEENFAESFLHFVIGKELPKALQAFMESL